ncbi:sirohydrochlorin chelatase [Streptomyces sp. M600PL45_2]|uniref:Sirohydrochlorin chelatase n=2 Tax=Streptomyces marispadix TaxID=2922868 RepID=A0ABS9SV58_9ACTN|nr:sirohydrochlorin chelatase [Streptomyces marispadix]MCH6160152.1 sirohydrochlorin chelatase [Streptomyces marispadix]
MTRLTSQLHTQLTAIRPAGARPATRAAAPVLVAVAHGSRDPAALRTVDSLLAAVRAARPGLHAELGHIELNEPALPRTLAALPRGAEVVLVPLLFGHGHHVKHDIPRALADAPHLRGTVAEPLGPHPLLAEALHERLTEAVRGESRGPDAVVLAAAGSRDPESADDTRRIAAVLGERLGGGTPVLPAYASAARPTVPEAVSTLRAEGHRRIAMASCFTAPGYFAARCAAEAPWAASSPIGAHPALVRLVLHRFDEACAAVPALRGGARRGTGTRPAAPAEVPAPALTPLAHA